MSKKKDTTQPEYLSAYQFGQRKDVSATAVYDKIKLGKIIPVLMGKRKFINWDEYKHIEFERAELFKPKEATQTT